MRYATGFTYPGILSGIVAVVVCGLSAFPTFASAQGTQGQNAVYNSSNGIVGSSAFIDASMFPAQGVDFCGVLHNLLLNNVPAVGAVIDARGLPGTTHTSMTCTASPWAGIANPPPSTILLPATGGASPNPIIIPGTWNLPPNTHVIGEGDGIPSGSSTPGTTIQAKANSFSGSMIQFGPSLAFCVPPEGGASICTGISVENLTLDGQSQSINGIANQFSGDQSYVDHVSLYQIRETGLLISASNSGPYSNITFDMGTAVPTNSTGG
jgi:hypothetical protein